MKERTLFNKIVIIKYENDHSIEKYDLFQFIRRNKLRWPPKHWNATNFKNFNKNSHIWNNIKILRKILLSDMKLNTFQWNSLVIKKFLSWEFCAILCDLLIIVKWNWNEYNFLTIEQKLLVEWAAIWILKLGVFKNVLLLRFFLFFVKIFIISQILISIYIRKNEDY